MTDLEFRGVSIRYGDLAVVDELDLVVPSGTIVGLVGESGCGKSSLARAAVGLIPISSGVISVGGEPVRGKGRRSGLQMVFQDPFGSLDPRMRIGGTVAEALPRSPRLSRAAKRAEVRRLLDLVGIDGSRERMLPSQLSGGQRQRVALARALASEPGVVIADEITSALDASVQGAVLNLVRRLRRELGLGMLFISHNMAVVRYVSDIVAVMREGKIVESGTPEDVLRAPRHPYTRELLAAAKLELTAEREPAALG